MNHSIVYSSHTVNTKILAESIKEALPEQDCDYFGGPSKI
ncbi:flavodoxin family protein [Proteocatella sphenisci]|nr:flavodoxin family protein [Proteocatella sphenisci]